MATLALVAGLLTLPAYGGSGAVAASAGRPVGLQQVQGPVTGTITSSGGKLYNNGNEIRLRGMNVAHQIPTPTDLDKLSSSGFNFLRYQFHWAEVEVTNPTYSGGKWNHTWDTAYMNEVKTFVQDAAARGIWVLIDQHGCEGCSYFNYPLYNYQAAYNSKGITYAQNDAGIEQASGDFWTDANRQGFLTDMWKYVAGQLKNVTGVMGYEIQNEPKQGYLENVHSTTDLMLDVQLSIATALRTVDANHVVVFTTRAGFGPGIPVADLTGWQALGNTVFDVHDYFGARWGDGLGGEVPTDDDYQELIQLLYNHLLADEGTSPYIGTTQVQAEFMKQVMASVQPKGIAVLVGEGGIYVTDPGAPTYFGTMTSAANALGISWSVSAFEGDLGIYYSDGTPKPYAQIVIDAAKAPY
jgi:hypothetical protein